MKLNYTKVGDYLLPNITVKNENKELNKYGYLRLNYLKKNKKYLYQELLMKEKLNEHLFSVGIEAEEKVNFIIQQLVEFDGTINEKLKSKNEMLWVQKMNTCKNIAEEIVLNEIVYV